VKIAIVGTRGIPNNYGGFETLAEYLVTSLSKDLEITVYCSSVDISSEMKEYKGARLKYIPFSSHGFSGIIYDSIALLNAVKGNDRILILGFGCGFIIPFLRKYRNKFVLNIGGLDWKRSKWPRLARKAIKFSERNLIKYSHTVIADNIGIQKYILDKYNKKGVFIAYGGNQAKKILPDETFKKEYPFLNKPYAFGVARVQPDNNIEMILNAFANKDGLPLVFVGNWENSRYGKKVKKSFNTSKNIILLDAIYDRERLDVLRSNCKVYIHGHSAGGTNPSLVEAMHLGLPVFAYASGYNEYTTENKALYFHNEQELSQLVENISNYDLAEIGAELEKVARQKYDWADIAKQYKEIFTASEGKLNHD